MSSLSMTNIDEITMRLVHYLVTKENYQPIIVAGLENEIWLENTEKHYEVIRINSNYIHNDEQLEYDNYKAKTIIKQLKRKMLSFKCNTLSILLNVGDNVDMLSNVKNIDLCKIESIKELNSDSEILSIFPSIKDDVIDGADDMDFFINVTNDINKKTTEHNRVYEKTFKKKPIIITYALIVINVLIFLLTNANVLDSSNFAMNSALVKSGDFYRIFTSAFFHGGVLHLFCNMYSLYILGTQLETVMGKLKFSIVYVASIIVSSLLSGVINGAGVASIGASGAIFGLMGALLYFGYHYRLYLGNVIIGQIVPLIALNLFIGFSTPGIDNWAHLGGLVGGMFSGMMVGVEGKTDKSDTTNGIIVTLILIGFLCYMLFFK